MQKIRAASLKRSVWRLKHDASQSNGRESPSHDIRMALPVQLIPIPNNANQSASILTRPYPFEMPILTSRAFGRRVRCDLLPGVSREPTLESRRPTPFGVVEAFEMPCRPFGLRIFRTKSVTRGRIADFRNPAPRI